MCYCKLTDLCESLRSAKHVAGSWQIFVKVSSLLCMLPINVFCYHYHHITHSKKLTMSCDQVLPPLQKSNHHHSKNWSRKDNSAHRFAFMNVKKHKVTCNNSVLVWSSVSTPVTSMFVILTNMAVICLMNSLILSHKQKVIETRQCLCIYVCIYFKNKQKC